MFSSKIAKGSFKGIPNVVFSISTTICAWRYRELLVVCKSADIFIGKGIEY